LGVIKNFDVELAALILLIVVAKAIDDLAGKLFSLQRESYSRYIQGNLDISTFGLQELTHTRALALRQQVT
jgi:hypothetical protein